MSMQSKLKTRGIMMLVIFFGLLAVIFMPVFPGAKAKVNGLDYMDNLFNMISKGSSYFIPKAMKDSDRFAGKMIDVKVALKTDEQATETVKIMEVIGAQAAVSGKEVVIKGDMGEMLKSSLADADFMFKNDGKPVADKYGIPEKNVMFAWHTVFGAIGKALTKQEKFDEAKPFANVQKKALEPAFNYYGVEAKKWNENLALIIFALAFYVAYTLWYGFGLMWIFEGLGLKIGH